MPEQRTRARPVAFHDDTRRAGRREFSAGRPPVLRTEVDVTAYTHGVRGPIEVDAELVAPRCFPVAVRLPLVRELDYLPKVSSAYLTEVRTMYASWTSNEARVTAFVASWAWDRMWWSRALRELASAMDPFAAQALSRPPRPRGPRSFYVERLLPVLGPGWTLFAGERVTAGHMARMTLQESHLRVALEALRPRLGPSPVAQGVLTEILDRQEAALAFFRAETVARVTRSPGEARAARLVLALGGDPLRPAGQRLPHEAAALAGIFREPADRAALRRAREDVLRLLPGPRGRGTLRHIPSLEGSRRGI